MLAVITHLISVDKYTADINAAAAVNKLLGRLKAQDRRIKMSQKGVQLFLNNAIALNYAYCFVLV
ncbi:MAG: hypothetical protein MUP90_02265 [Gammaproteobacteria bacterium]|nr:hypothetical protein [Gammaproteobacteria bacterium]